jgi:hypothetical protein
MTAHRRRTGSSIHRSASRPDQDPRAITVVERDECVGRRADPRLTEVDEVRDDEKDDAVDAAHAPQAFPEQGVSTRWRMRSLRWTRSCGSPLSSMPPTEPTLPTIPFAPAHSILRATRLRRNCEGGEIGPIVGSSLWVLAIGMHRTPARPAGGQRGANGCGSLKGSFLQGCCGRAATGSAQPSLTRCGSRAANFAVLRKACSRLELRPCLSPERRFRTGADNIEPQPNNAATD